MIRRATEADLLALLPFAEAFHAYYPLTAGREFDPIAQARGLLSFIEGENSVVLMHDHGAIGGIVSPLWCDPSVKVATELFWWAERDGLALKTAFEEWARATGADYVQMISIFGKRDVAPIYRRSGYMPVEACFVRAF